MAAISDYLEQQLLNHIFRGASFDKPLDICIALTSDVAKDNQDGSSIPELPETTEAGVSTGYSRKSLQDPAENGDSSWSEVGVDDATSYEVSLDGTTKFQFSSDGGDTFQTFDGSGYYYPVYLNQARAALEDNNNQTYVIKFEDDFPGVSFYAPRSSFASGIPTTAGLLSYEGNGFIKNQVQIIFDQALTNWGFVSGIAILDSASYGQGNLLMYAPLRNPREVFAGDEIKFEIQSLEVSLT